jgi:hypothetical protein
MATSNIIFTRSNIVAGSNNTTLLYKFPNSVSFPNHEIALSSLAMFYAWRNIDLALYGNNTLTYTWENAGNVQTTYTITIPDGLYEIADINSYCQYVMIANGHYLVNASGQNVYFFNFVVNPNLYAIQLNTYQFPTALPVGWSNPAAVVFPAQTFKPQVATPSNFNAIIGFVSTFISARNLGTAYPNTASYVSTSSPQVQPAPTLILNTSNINNIYSNPSTCVYAITPTVAIGEQIVERPPEFSWNKLTSGTYSEIRLQLSTPTGQIVPILDPQMTIILAIREIGGPNNRR